MNSILINKEKTIYDALKRLNEITNISRLILFVTDNNNRIIGSLTDGDIRRSLILDTNIRKKIEDVCRKDFFFEYDSNSFLDLNKYRDKDIKILPILNKRKNLVDLIDLEKIKSKLPVECMIMAGGKGKRLSPLTNSVPKPMLKLGGIPIIEHNINNLISYGIKKIYISLNYLGSQIEEYFGDGSSKGISIEYVWEDKFLGTAGALGLVKEFKTDNILLMNSDLFTNVNFQDLFLKLTQSNADMAISSTNYKVDIPFAIFETKQDKIISFKEKPSYDYYSNSGIYLLTKKLINDIPKNKFFDITDLMDLVLKRGGNLVYKPISGYWIDIGSKSDYNRAKEFINHLN